MNEWTESSIPEPDPVPQPADETIDTASATLCASVWRRSPSVATSPHARCGGICRTCRTTARTASLRDQPYAVIPRRWTGVALATAAVALAGAAWSLWPRPVSSIVVLPCTTNGLDSGVEDLVHGVVNGVIDRLTPLPLRVIPRATAFKYRGADPSRVGQDLNVRATLTCHVEQRGATLTLRFDLDDIAQADTRLDAYLHHGPRTTSSTSTGRLRRTSCRRSSSSWIAAKQGV